MTTISKPTDAAPAHPYAGSHETEAFEDDHPVAETPVLEVSAPLTLPSGIASNVKQHALLVRDSSGSMGGSKIQELGEASVALGRELADPVNKDGFRVSVIDFSDQASVRCSAVSAVELVMPIAQAGGGTNFDAALLKTIEAIRAFDARPNPEGWRYLRPHVVFLSDGHSSVSERTIADLQEIATVMSVAYGADAARPTLDRIASDGKAQVIGTNGAELRKFFAQVGKTLSQGRAKAR